MLKIDKFDWLGYYKWRIITDVPILIIGCIFIIGTFLLTIYFNNWVKLIS